MKEFAPRSDPEGLASYPQDALMVANGSGSGFAQRKVEASVRDICRPPCSKSCDGACQTEGPKPRKIKVKKKPKESSMAIL